MLELKQIKKTFGERTVLDGLELTIKQGRIYTLIGDNGSGKTTVFNLITGFMKPDSGRILLKNEQIANKQPYKINRLGITRTFQDLRLIKNITVKENILLSFRNNKRENVFNALMPKSLFKEYELTLERKADDLLNEISLRDVAGQAAGEISYGQQKLLTIGCCLANDPELLLLDEPVAGIDKDNYVKILNLILGIKKKGKTILLIEHNREFIEAVSDEIIFLSGGRSISFQSYKDYERWLVSIENISSVNLSSDHKC